MRALAIIALVLALAGVVSLIGGGVGYTPYSEHLEQAGERPAVLTCTVVNGEANDCTLSR